MTQQIQPVSEASGIVTKDAMLPTYHIASCPFVRPEDELMLIHNTVRGDYYKITIGRPNGGLESVVALSPEAARLLRDLLVKELGA